MNASLTERYRLQECVNQQSSPDDVVISRPPTAMVSPVFQEKQCGDEEPDSGGLAPLLQELLVAAVHIRQRYAGVVVA